MVMLTGTLLISQRWELQDPTHSTFHRVSEAFIDRELDQIELIDQCHLRHPRIGNRRILGWLVERS